MDRVRLILLLCLEISVVCAQQDDAARKENGPYMGAQVTPSMAIIIIVLITAMFFMGFFSLYIRRCSDNNTGGSMRTMVAAVAGRSRRARGLDQAALQALPTFAYSEVKGLKIGKGALECAVCLNEFEDDETLRLIPKCDHVFHSECIDIWLASHTTCPVCRGDISSTEPDPVENPVAEPESDVPNPHTAQVEIPIGATAPELNRGNRPVRSWSMKLKPRLLSKIPFPRSYSTGHTTGRSAVHPDRFTLRLPNDVRSQLLNRASSLVALPRDTSSRRGGEGSSRGRFQRRVDRIEPGAKSERWGFSIALPFFSRASSMRSPKVAAEGVATSSTAAAEVVNSKDVGPSDTDRLPV